MSGGFPHFGDVCNCNDQGTDTANSRGTGLPNFNTWTELVASTPSDTSLMAVQITYDASNNWQVVADIGIGAAGSEIVLIPDLLAYASIYMVFPLNIPAGTRIAARPVADQSATFTVSVGLFDSGFADEGGAGVDVIGYSGANEGGTTVTPNATANTKGSYTQLSASTSRDYLGFFIELDVSNTNPVAATGRFSLTDIAIGAGGSEIIIVPNVQWYRGPGQARHFIPMAIPAGTRISARCAVNAASGTPIGVMLYGVYK